MTGECPLFGSNTTISYLSFYAKYLQDFDKGVAKDDPRMRLCNLDDIKQHRHRFAVVLEMDSEGNVSVMVR
jgi:hypothetical protein